MNSETLNGMSDLEKNLVMTETQENLLAMIRIIEELILRQEWGFVEDTTLKMSRLAAKVHLVWRAA